MWLKALSVDRRSSPTHDEIEFAELERHLVSSAAHAAAMGDDRGHGMPAADDPRRSLAGGVSAFVRERSGAGRRVIKALSFHAVQGSSLELRDAGWGLPRVGLGSLSEDALKEMLNLRSVWPVLSEGRPGVAGEGTDVVLSRAWFNLYYGTGVTEPSVARGPESAALRGQPSPWKQSVGLLLGECCARNTVQQVVDIRPRQASPSSSPWVSGDWGATYFVVPEDVRDIPHVATFGGGFRMVGTTPEEDVVIAALEALFFQKQQRPRPEPYLRDRRDRVRWTAGKLFALASGKGMMPSMPCSRAMRYIDLCLAGTREESPGDG